MRRAVSISLLHVCILTAVYAVTFSIADEGSRKAEGVNVQCSSVCQGSQFLAGDLFQCPCIYFEILQGTCPEKQYKHV